MDIKLGQWCAARDDLQNVRDAPKQTDQFWFARDQDRRATASVNERDVSDELQRVAEPLLGMQQNSLAGKL